VTTAGMEIVDLYYMTTVADAGRLARAAKVLGVDTSTVSRRVGNLENELGLSLFERDHSGIRRTRAGDSVLACARRALFHFGEVKRIGRQFASGTTGEVRLGVRHPPIAGAARELLASWRAAFPEVDLTISEGSQRELALGLAEHRLDVALVTGHEMWVQVTAVPIFRERLVAAVPAEHALAHRQVLDWASLRPETMLIPGWGDNQTQREFYATLLGSGTRFAVHAASRQTIVALVGVGAGIALVTHSQAEVTFPGVVFRPIDEPNAWLDFGLAWLPESEDPVVGRFIAFLRDESRARRFV
jgi:DNA-binding transcriptional LysR family regulator